MELRLLGPVAVHARDRLVPAGPPQQRTVLAALAVDAGRPVPVEVLMDRLWGDDPPPRARRTLHTHITRIRRLLEDAGAEPLPIVRQAGGYVLHIDRNQVDLHRFRQLGESARDPACPDARRVLLLQQALRPWQGQALAGLPGSWAARTRQALQQEYVDASVAWAQAELRIGNPTAVIGTLTNLLDEHPLFEPLTATLMRALYAAGRGAQALNRYATTRRRLADELGADPSPELQQLHQAILRGDLEQAAAEPAPAGATHPVPAQLPMDVPAFTGRIDELAQLDALLAGAGQPANMVVVSVLSGAAGVGKTALAVRWAHRVASRFPDGQLYVNLRGYDPEQLMSPTDALARFLSALGVASEDIPLDVDERAARYRSAVAGRRMLIVLDNAATVEQVRPLLPGIGSSVVVVTSRDSLAGLVSIHGAHRLDLDLLPRAEAVTLLRRLIGARLDAEPAAANELADQCARLPLALRVAAELAVARPSSSVADLVAELADRQRRLELLDAGGDPRAAVTTVFSWSVQQLPPDAAATFRLLGLHPGPDIDLYATAALTDTSFETVRNTLDLLSRIHLVQSTGPRRYSMHDLLRAYAAHLVTVEDTNERRREALDRLFDHYLATVAAAMATLYPAEADRRPGVTIPATPAPSLDEAEAARLWLDTELACLVAVAAYTAAHGWPTHTTRLSTVLFRYLECGHYSEALTIHGHAHDAARRAGDSYGQAGALRHLGVTYVRLGQYGTGVDRLRQALALHRQVGDGAGGAQTLSNIGVAERRMGNLGSSADHQERALAAFRRIGDQTGEAIALINLGSVEDCLGRYESALDHLTQALALCRKLDYPFGEATALSGLGIVEERIGRCQLAAEHHAQALAVFRGLGDQNGEAYTLDNLGVVDIRLGRPVQAAAHFERALALFRQIGGRSSEAWPLNGLGEAARSVGRHTDALSHHTDALRVATETRTRDQQARAHAGLGHAYRGRGDPARARTHYEHALALYTELGMPQAEDVRDHLATGVSHSDSRQGGQDAVLAIRFGMCR